MAKRKTLGSTQEKIVLYLANNPGKTMSDMQKDFGIPRNSYNVIHRPTKVLEEMGYVTFSEKPSEKARPKYPVSLTEKGVLYALSKTPEIKKIKKILGNYSTIYPGFKRYLELSQELGDELFIKISPNLFYSYSMYDTAKSEDDRLQIGWSLGAIFGSEMDEEDREKFFDVIFKIYPEFLPEFNKMAEQFMKMFRKYGASI